MFTVVLIQVLVTFMITGLSWYVQIAQYPLFQYVSEADFKNFHFQHVARTNVVIMALLPAEMVTSAITAYYGFPGLSHRSWILGFMLTLAICLCTALIQIPLHSKLSKGKDVQAIRKLVHSHWIRTLLWSLRTALLLLWVSVSHQA